MQLIRGLHNLRPEHRGCVATIGNFDGVHLGHQTVFRRLIEEGRELGLPATVITFEPQPLEFFAPVKAPARLTRLREKLIAIANTGIDRVLVLEFNHRLATMTADDFVRHFLIDALGIHHLYVGDDFRFGHNRIGNKALLESLGQENGFRVDDLPTVSHLGERISSTRIRQALHIGDLATAASCLGRPFRLCGRVSHGNKRGRTIGFPTANLNLHRHASPLNGVFAVRIQGIAPEQSFEGVANIGTRPTVDRNLQYLLEVHLFNFQGDLYGHHLSVEPVKRIRKEKKFDSFELLRRQILNDAQEARDLFIKSHSET